LTDSRLEAEFLPGAGRQLLVTWRLPQGQTTRGSLLVIPPLAEEMNKARPVLRDLGQAVAESGWALCLPDLSGTGDSEGDFGDATVDHWCQDLDAVYRHCSDRGYAVRGCLAVRGGALLAERWLTCSGVSLDRLLLWQPVLEGRQVVNQWLRTRVAASMFNSAGRVTQAELKEQLAQGDSVESGGYQVSAGLARDLEGMSVQPERLDAGRVSLIEIGNHETPAPALQAAAAGLSGGRLVKVAGEPFWSSSEIVRNPELVQVTCDALTGP